MEFSINYSPAAAQLLRDGKIRVDRFKTTEWPSMIATASELLPVYVHYPTSAGKGEASTWDVPTMEQKARETNTPLMNIHLVARGQDWPDAEVDAPEFDNAVAERLIADVADFASRVDGGASRVIAENLIYTGQGSMYLRAAIEPSTINRVLDATGCGFLLDLSHARIAAHYKGMDWKDYIGRLPVERMRELHITGLREVNGVIVDHEPLTEQDWLDVEWAMERIRQGDWPTPWMVALEYGGEGKPFAHRTDPQVIAEQVPRLGELVARNTRG